MFITNSLNNLDYTEIMNKLYKEHKPVDIIQLKNYKYVVALKDTNYWLEGFDEVQEAIDYCLFHKLPYTCKPLPVKTKI